MASTTFINNQTVIVADWLNDVNDYTYNGESLSGILNGTTLALQTGGLDAINIDASQQVSVANLNVTGTFTLSSGVVVDGDLEFSDGTIQSSAAFCVANNCLYENNQTISDNYTVTNGRSASSVGPITVAPGKAVTLPSGSRWVIL
jgi:hypothetical protein